MFFLSQIGRFFLNLICPTNCPICHEETDAAHCLCPNCFNELRFITKPCCEICGRPFEYSPFKEILCGACMQHKPAFKMARSILHYDHFSKQLILAFKHGDHTELAPLFTKLLLQVDKKVFEADLILSVPLHRYRLMKRKYNQASLLGKSLSKKLNIPFYPTILKRNRSTPSQGHMRRKQRQKNVLKAFSVSKQELIRNKTVLLLDDVMTTGATINECAKTLKRAGAKNVHVLTVYRVI